MNISSCNAVDAIVQTLVTFPTENMDLDSLLTSSYLLQGLPYVAILLLAEYLVLWIQGKPTPRFNDTVTSLCLGLLQECSKICMRTFEMGAYLHIYDRYRLVDLPPEPAVSWIFAAVLVDFGFYWVHRAGHEINFLWGHHQVHHSSDELNVTVGIRHGVFNSFLSRLIYSPLAFIIPPSLFVVQQQLNLGYQIWIHTETIGSLGVLEWFFNTPEHHQVHHGRNVYALDKNYGGILIIWDRLFGTFASKRPEETIRYSLVFPPMTFNPIKLQTYYYTHLWNRVKSYENWRDKLQAIIKGPSWEPGSPWTGWQHLKLKLPQYQNKFDVAIPLWRRCYIGVHFILLAAVAFFLNTTTTPVGQLCIFTVYVAVSAFNFGCLLDDYPAWTYFLELFRCLLTFFILKTSNIEIILCPVIYRVFCCSTVFWVVVIFLKHNYVLKLFPTIIIM